MILNATRDFNFLVGWEISNEDTGSTNNTDWQDYIIDHINTYQASFPRQHLVMRTVAYPGGSNAALDASDAQLVSYNADKADDVQDGTKVAFRDSDHVEGLDNDYDWVWTALCNGSGGAWYMDEWDGELRTAPTAGATPPTSEFGITWGRLPILPPRRAPTWWAPSTNLEREDL